MKAIKLLCLGLIFPAVSWSQSIERSVIASAGSYSSAGSVSLSWTLGETVIQTASAASVILTQGFQQPASATSSLKQTAASFLSVYPNPSQGVFYVKLNSNQTSVSQNMKVLVLDAAGKQVGSYALPVGNNTAVLDLTFLPGGVYTVNFTAENQQQSTYRLTIVR